MRKLLIITGIVFCVVGILLTTNVNALDSKDLAPDFTENKEPGQSGVMQGSGKENTVPENEKNPQLQQSTNAVTGPVNKGSTANCTTPPFGLNCISNYSNIIINIILTLSGSIALILLITGSIQWITSGGDPKALSKAKGTLTYAIIGLVIILLSFAIKSLVVQFLGIKQTPLSF